MQKVETYIVLFVISIVLFLKFRQGGESSLWENFALNHKLTYKFIIIYLVTYKNIWFLLYAHLTIGSRLWENKWIRNLLFNSLNLATFESIISLKLKLTVNYLSLFLKY